MGEEEEPMCRYCFGDSSDGELISPCKCIGGQKYVHLNCLRRWQRMVLVSQPTHPAYYSNDIRQHVCKVCQTKFTCEPPTRGELMASFTGPEIAALIMEDRIIASRDVVSDKMEQDLESMPSFYREASGYKHWIKGVFLITEVKKDIQPKEISIELENAQELSAFLEKVGNEFEVSTQDITYRLVSERALEGVKREEYKDALGKLKLPCSLVLKRVENCADDLIAAVNLTREIDKSAVNERLLKESFEKYPACRRVKIQHFIGGPCDPNQIACCIVMGGESKGWTITKDFNKAVILACSRGGKRNEEQGGFGGGQAVKFKDLVSKPELNGKEGLTLRFDLKAKRWLIRIGNGDILRIKPENLTPMESNFFGHVLCFWGDAQWTRAQLLGEIARGHWGLCQASVTDFIAKPSERWGRMTGRLAYAPISDMTEEWLKTEGQRLMQNYHQEAEDAQRAVEQHREETE